MTLAPEVGTRFAVLASGSGTNLQALIDADLPGQLVLVVTNRPNAGAIARASKHGIVCAVVDHTLFPSRKAFESALIERLDAERVELVVLAGFMRVLTPLFVERFADCIVNIHPSLLPNFPGADGIGDALRAGVTKTGVTVHFVDTGVDTGAIIAQQEVPIEVGEGRATLAERIHAVEHALYPRVVGTLLRERPWRRGSSIRGEAT